MTIWCCCWKPPKGVIEGEDLQDRFSMPKPIEGIPESQEMECIRKASMSIASMTEMARSESAVSAASYDSQPQQRLERAFSEPGTSIFPTIKPSSQILPNPTQIDTESTLTVMRVVNTALESEPYFRALACQISPRANGEKYPTCQVVKNWDYLVVSPLWKA